MSSGLSVLAWCTCATAFAYFVVLSIPALFPLAAVDWALDASAVSYFGAATFATAMISSLAAGALIQRFGPIPVFRIGMLSAACGLLLAAFGPVKLLIFAAVLTGVGYGPMNALTATLLFQNSEPRRRGTYFSIKQSGVALGGALVGSCVPPLAALLGWRWALAAIAGTAVLVSLSDRWLRPDVIVDRSVRFSFRSLVEQHARTLRVPALRRLAAIALAFNSLQSGTATVLITYLTADVGISMVAAGALLSVSQAAGLLGRIGWGVLADRTGRPVMVLATLGPAMALFAVAVPLFDADSSLLALGAIVFALGLTSSGWNGVFLAEVARCASPGQVSSATGCCAAFALAGGAVGPAIFGIGYTLTQSYAAGFMITAVLVALVSIRVMRVPGPP